MIATIAPLPTANDGNGGRLARRRLRDYQLESIDAVRRELERVNSTLLVLPTGCGKTVVMARFSSEWEDGNVLLLAHRVELLDQAADKLESELGYRPVIEQADREADLDFLWRGGAVIVGSVQTMRSPRRMGKFANFPFGLILIDEAHHATAASYRTVIDYYRSINPRLKVLGVTATPNRQDSAALGMVFDSVAYHMPIYDAVECGWLTPIRQEFVSCANVDFSKVGVGVNELGESDLKASELEDVLADEEALHALARPILDKAGDSRQCLVFASGVRHAHELAAVLNRYRDNSARAVDGKTLTTERKDTVAAFAEGKLQFLCNFGVFTEGFDCPSVGIVAMGRPTKSLGLYTQMLGRGTRPLGGVVDGPATPDLRKAAIALSGKPEVLVLDFVGNSRHKLVSSVDVLGGNYDVETRELATARVKKAAASGANVADELKKAKAELALIREQSRRKSIKASVDYSAWEVDPFDRGGDASPGMASAGDERRGGSSDSQVAFLVSLGVDRQTALAYGRKQASAVIDDLKRKRCTAKQRAILDRYGLPADGVSFDMASQAIDAIASNGWRLPEGLSVGGGREAVTS